MDIYCYLSCTTNNLYYFWFKGNRQMKLNSNTKKILTVIGVAAVLVAVNMNVLSNIEINGPSWISHWVYGMSLVGCVTVGMLLAYLGLYIYEVLNHKEDE
jgi:hypothetical protein